MDIGAAVAAMRAGQRVARRGWNGKGMWIALSPGDINVPAEKFWSAQGKIHAAKRGGYADVLPCIIMRTADGMILMGWLASQTDLLALDWEIA